MRGRAAGTVDNLRGTAYIAREAQRIGLEPAGDEGTFFQNVPLISREVPDNATLQIEGRTFKYEKDFFTRYNGRHMRPIDGATVIYGGSWADPSKLLDPSAAAGKIVVITNPSGWLVGRNALTERYASAAAIVSATLSRVPENSLVQFMGPSYELPEGETPSAPVPSFLYVSDEVAKVMFGGSDPANLPVGTVGRIVRGGVQYTGDPAPARNVVAILRGSDPRLRGQYVALGAHNDHLSPSQTVDHDSLRAVNIVAFPSGAESTGGEITAEQWRRIRAMIDSMRKLRAPRPDSINNGADDDGTGSMGLLEIAEAFANAQVKPKRSLLFVWHTGEEVGLVGSKYFTDHPTVPRDSIVAQLNIDMIGRGTEQDAVRELDDRIERGGPDYVEVIGSRRLSTELGNIVDDVNRRQSRPLVFDYNLDANGEPHQYYCRSDHYEYARFGIPIAFFFTGVHNDYHQVTDEPQYIDYPKYARIVQLVHDIAARVADLDHRVVVDKPKPNPNGSCIQ
jgi:hypothetical protein